MHKASHCDRNARQILSLKYNIKKWHVPRCPAWSAVHTGAWGFEISANSRNRQNNWHPPPGQVMLTASLQQNHLAVSCFHLPMILPHSNLIFKERWLDDKHCNSTFEPQHIVTWEEPCRMWGQYQWPSCSSPGFCCTFWCNLLLKRTTKNIPSSFYSGNTNLQIFLRMNFILGEVFQLWFGEVELDFFREHCAKLPAHLAHPWNNM